MSTSIMSVTSGAALALFVCGPAQATTTYTNRANFLSEVGSVVTEDFENCATGYGVFNEILSSETPLRCGSIIPGLKVIGSPGFYFAAPGQGNNNLSTGLIVQGAPGSPFILQFSSLPNAVGIDLVNQRTSDLPVFLTVVGQLELIKEVILTGFDDFYGIRSDIPIFAVYISQRSAFAGIDNISFSSNVPEPSTWGLMFLGISIVGARLRNANRSVQRN